MTAIQPPLPDLRPPLAQGPLRICLLGYRSHPHVGGQGIYLHYLSRALVDLGHEVNVISGPPYPELDARVGLIKLPSLDLYAHPHPHRALRWHHLKSFTDTYEWWSKLSGSFAEPYTFGRRLVKYFRRHGCRYDVIHDNQSLCFGLLQLQRQGLPLVTTVHHPITRDRDLALAAVQQWKARHPGALAVGHMPIYTPRPLFEAIGRRTFDAGTSPASASAIKLANNFVLGCAIEAIGESFALVRKNGVAAAVMQDVLTDGLFDCVAYRTYARIIADEAYDHVGFSATLALKDATLVLAAGEAARVPLPGANTLRDRLLGAIAHGDGGRDWAVIAREQARASGLD